MNWSMIEWILWTILLYAPGDCNITRHSSPTTNRKQLHKPGLVNFQVQSTFYRYVASPLFEEWHRFLGSPLSTIMTKNLTSNQVTRAFLNDVTQLSPPFYDADLKLADIITKIFSILQVLKCWPLYLTTLIIQILLDTSSIWIPTI